MSFLYRDEFGWPPSWRRDEYEELLLLLEEPAHPGVLVLGPAGIGKTALLRLAEAELRDRRRAAFFVRLAETRDERDLGALIARTVVASRLAPEFRESRLSRGSRGGTSLAEVAAELSFAGRDLRSPVLLLDGLDEAPLPFRVAGAIEELSHRLHDWQIVVSSRPEPLKRIVELRELRVLELRGLRQADARRLLSAALPDVPPETLDRAAQLADGNPLILRLVAEELRLSGGLPAAPEGSLATYLGRVLANVAGTASDPDLAAAILERLAAISGPETAKSLAANIGASEMVTVGLLSELGPVVDRRDGDAAVTLCHASLRDAIVESRIFAEPFTLADLDFGDAEAEKDTLFEASYVRRPELGRRTIVVGDRGSGKSAIFRAITGDASTGSIDGEVVLPVRDPYPFLNRVAVQGEEPSSAEQYRAAWLLMVAWMLASSVPEAAPKELRALAQAVRTAVGLDEASPSRAARALRAIGRMLSGTSLTFAVGPLNLAMQVPDGSPKSRGTAIDIEKFLQLHDAYLREMGRRAAVPIDRVDEVSKYARGRQEMLVQGLLQAESAISQLKRIRMIVFLRTDLFEFHDIQEKNKLVSRQLDLRWSETDLLQLLVNRIFVNPRLSRLARRLRDDDGKPVDVPMAFAAIFPREVEGRPVRQWLIESLQNGNGDISPRSIVLLLMKARDVSEDLGDRVSKLPLFSGDALRQAMTEVSRLSYEEIVTDFQVATTFVQNCRANKQLEFVPSAVTGLFAEGEGAVSHQVQLLERLGFLERIVSTADTGKTWRYRIPPLYTRCWEHA